MSDSIRISIVVAMGTQNQIGLNNQLLWHIREDLQNFKKLTSGHPIVMGRKTFESIGKALPGRDNIVLTRNPQFKAHGTIVCPDFQAALEYANANGNKEMFIIGGGEIYKQTLNHTDRIYLSQVDFSGEADTFFPQLDYSEWHLISETPYAATGTSPSWTFKELGRV